MNWGKSITVAFVLFGAFIATLVTVCMRQDVNLVTPEYYKEELAYQEQIDRIEHASTLSKKPVIKVSGGDILTVSYPDFNLLETGVLQLFRPSDPKMDKEFELQRGNNPTQYFSTEGMARGMYRARLRWTLEDRDYFVEQVIHL